jgi:metallo-beta-lactamase family protein
VDGEKTVKIHGQMVPVNARVEIIESMSAHADSTEILRWLGGFSRPPRKTFIVHGEPPAMAALRSLIQTRLGWTAHMPEHGEVVRLDS